MTEVNKRLSTFSTFSNTALLAAAATNTAKAASLYNYNNNSHSNSNSNNNNNNYSSSGNVNIDSVKRRKASISSAAGSEYSNNVNSKRYSVAALWSMVAEIDKEVNDELTKGLFL
jgi:hypothetical protein